MLAHKISRIFRPNRRPASKPQPSRSSNTSLPIRMPTPTSWKPSTKLRWNWCRSYTSTRRRHAPQPWLHVSSSTPTSTLTSWSTAKEWWRFLRCWDRAAGLRTSWSWISCRRRFLLPSAIPDSTWCSTLPRWCDRTDLSPPTNIRTRQRNRDSTTSETKTEPSSRSEYRMRLRQDLRIPQHGTSLPRNGTSKGQKL